MVFFVTIVHGDVSPRTFSRRFYFCGAVDRKNGSRWSYVMCFDMTSLFVNEWISVCRKEELSFYKYISERICTKFWLCKSPYHHLEGIPSDPEAVMSSAQVLLLIPKVVLWWTSYPIMQGPPHNMVCHDTILHAKCQWGVWDTIRTINRWALTLCLDFWASHGVSLASIIEKDMAVGQYTMGE